MTVSRISSAYLIGLFLLIASLSGCDFLGQFGPSAKIPDNELIMKSVACISEPQSSPTTVEQCKNYKRECERRNRMLNRFLC